MKIYARMKVFVYLFVCTALNECHYLRLHCNCEIWGLQGCDYKCEWRLQCDAVHSGKTVPKYQEYTLSIIKVANSYSKYNINSFIQYSVWRQVQNLLQNDSST
jgi:hypothetical protein